MKPPPSAVAALALVCLALPACEQHQEHAHHEHQKIVVTNPVAKDVTITEQYVCQIHSRQHIKVRAIESGYLDTITVREGQEVNKGDLLFKVVPILFQARLEAERAEVRLAQIKLDNTKRLYGTSVVSQQEVLLSEAELAKSQAKMRLAEAELNFCEIKAPFDGIIDRLEEQTGSLVKEEAVLTTLSDNSVMWVYFNVPEARYFDYMTNLVRSKNKGKDKKKSEDKRKVKGKDDNDDGGKKKKTEEEKGKDDDDDGGKKKTEDKGKDKDDDDEESRQIELLLANGSKFPYPGKIGAIEAKFNNETGNIPFRADFPNPDRLLRHGQTGTVFIHRTQHDALVIPQRATFEILDKQYVWVVGEDGVVHQRPVTIEHEMEDIYVVKRGLNVKDKIILEGVREVHDGDKLDHPEFVKPSDSLSHQKQHAE